MYEGNFKSFYKYVNNNKCCLRNIITYYHRHLATVSLHKVLLQVISRANIPFLFVYFKSCFKKILYNIKNTKHPECKCFKWISAPQIYLSTKTNFFLLY